MGDASSLAWQSLQELSPPDMDVPPILMLRMVCASGKCPIRRCDECPSMQAVSAVTASQAEINESVNRHLLAIANMDKDAAQGC